jgi:hypothetical protein
MCAKGESKMPGRSRALIGALLGAMLFAAAVNTHAYGDNDAALRCIRDNLPQ